MADDSPQYGVTPRSFIVCGDREKFEYLSKNLSKIENILTHWSLTKGGSKDEKTGCRESRWTVPFLRVPRKKVKHTKQL